MSPGGFYERGEFANKIKPDYELFVDTGKQDGDNAIVPT